MYNNPFGYNPYMTLRYNVPSVQPMEQPISPPVQTTPIPSQRTILNGKIVDSLEVARAIDYQLDGSVNFFPLADGTAILTKQLKTDGTSKVMVYKPVEEEQKDTPKYATIDDIKNSIEKLDLGEIDDIKEEIKELKQELKKLKKGE